MKKNLNSLKALISRFNKLTCIEQRILILDAIMKFHSQKIKQPCINSKNGEISNEPIEVFALKTGERSYQAGSNFVRIRKIQTPDEPMNQDDFWEPKEEYIKSRGRLNDAHEPMLYFCDSIKTATKETRTQHSDTTLRIFYEFRNEVSFTEILMGEPFQNGEVDRIRSKFLINLFNNPSPKIYKLCNLIAKRYLNLSSDGWCYKSVANNLEGTNFCLKTSSKKKLRIVNAFLFKDGAPQCSYQVTEERVIPSTASEAKSTWHDFMVQSKHNKTTLIKTPNNSFTLKPIHLQPLLDSTTQ